MSIEEKLASLGARWVVSLSTTSATTWRIRLISPSGVREVRAYEGDLANVIGRAHAGDPPDADSDSE